MATASKLNKPLLSVAIISYNEQRIIEKTLNAIHNWVDQIVVVDSGSTDNTLSILEMFNVMLYKEKWRGYSGQKNFAISKCTGNWILSLDADEIITNELKDEILQSIKNHNEYDGFKIKRKFYIGTRWIQYGGYYPDYQLRLFKHGINARFTERAVHESVTLEGPVSYLNNPLEHYAYANIKEYKKALKKYAELASKEIPSKTFYLPFLRAAWAFAFRYICRLGFLEGKIGFQLAKAYGKYVFDKYTIASKSK